METVTQELIACDISDDPFVCDDESVKQLKEKFSKVALWIKDQNRIDVWMHFFDLVDRGVFPSK